MMLLRAFMISIKAHNGQKDRGGKPYILHSIYVMIKVKGYRAKVLALLHDVVEDSDYTLDILSKYFDDEIINALNLLTKKDNEKYQTYINNIKNNELARLVKIEDIKHNMNLKRLNNITQADMQRLNKYKKALKVLQEGIYLDEKN